MHGAQQMSWRNWLVAVNTGCCSGILCWLGPRCTHIHTHGHLWLLHWLDWRTSLSATCRAHFIMSATQLWVLVLQMENLSLSAPCHAHFTMSATELWVLVLQTGGWEKGEYRIYWCTDVIIGDGATGGRALAPSLLDWLHLPAFGPEEVDWIRHQC